MNTAIVVVMSGLSLSLLLLMVIVYRQQQQINEIIAWGKGIDDVLIDGALATAVDDKDDDEDDVIVQ